MEYWRKRMKAKWIRFQNTPVKNYANREWRAIEINFRNWCFNLTAV